MAGIGEVANATRASMGRYFSLLSVLPSILLTLYLYLLIASGAWTGDPSPSRALKAASDLDLGSTTLLVLASLWLGLILHPLQFAFVQLLEGYWGAGSLPARLRAVRILHQWRRLGRLRRQSLYAESHLGSIDKDRLPETYALLSSRWDEADRLTANYPDDLRLTMPTRLGSVLRYYETAAGFPFGLNAIQIMPYVARVAPAEDMDYVNDQRSLLDLAVRMTFIGFLATAISVVFLWQHGLWLLLALIPYCVAYLSYRGAVVAAGAYGRAFAAVIAINRFALYERLRLPLPTNNWNEREANARLEGLLADSGTADGDGTPSKVWLRYQHGPDLPGNAPHRAACSDEARSQQADN